jgi:glycosyltransferase involved in cell wall biosynthesis
VHDEAWNEFKEQFGLCIYQMFGNDYDFRYDNLIHLLIMVKDAGEGFKEILRQNLPYVDYWTFLDTGSTDGTVATIEEVMKSKPGKLYQEPFINFRDSRNRLLDLAGEKCVFNVMLDDTYVLKGQLREFLTYVRGDDVADSFTLFIKENDMKYGSNRITKPEKKLRYKYTIHEIIETNYSVQIPEGNAYIFDVSTDYMRGRTKDRKKKDFVYLDQELKENPSDPRTYYYIAETHLCVEDWKSADEWYVQRAKMGGYAEEKQDSIYKHAVMNHLHLGTAWELCHQMYLDAWRFDTERPEGLFMIGYHYATADRCSDLAFMYLKKAFQIGIPGGNHGMNLKIEQYYINLPKYLIPLCYEKGDYELGEQACRRRLNFRSDDVTTAWLNIFYHLNQNTPHRGKVKINYCSNKLVVFLMSGGWAEWNGETLRTRGLGGSETFVIRFAETIVKNYGQEYTSVVFCKCGEKRILYNGVMYIPLTEYYEFVGTYNIHVVFVNRYPEYLSLTVRNNVPVYLVLHDLVRDYDIIDTHHLVKGVICLGDWHVQQVLNYFPAFTNRITTLSYGIETGEFPEAKTEYARFIYPSFPHRGLYWLLKMFPRIVERYPRAKLDVFCNTKQEWVRGVAGPMMDAIDQMLEEQKEHVTNHGWVNGATLKEYWSRAHIWFYTCDFKETCCLTGYEAACSKTLAITSSVAALQETVADRGVMIPGSADDEKWREIALDCVFQCLEKPAAVKDYVDRNYAWAQTKKYDIVVADFVNRFVN